MHETQKKDKVCANWMQTINGGRFHFPPDFEDVEKINIEDIAHALSNICRFGGHCPEFYSVAQHSVMVSRLVPEEIAIIGLLHDATEAYISDIVRPAKVHLPQYQRMEKTINMMIGWRFGVNMHLDEVKIADNQALYAEAMAFFGSVEGWNLEGFECDELIHPMPPREAKGLFLARWHELTG